MYAVDGARRLPEHALDHLPGLRRLAPGADRQRRGRAATDRRARRGHDRARAEAATQVCPATTNAWSLQRKLVDRLAETWQEPDHGLWEIRGPVAALHPLPGDGLGGVRPSGARGGEARPRRTGRAVARAARRGPRRGARPRLRRGAQLLHPALRHDRGRRLAAGAAADRLHRGRRPADARHDRGRRARPDARRAAAALPHRVGRRRAPAAASTRSWRARSGWSRRTPRPAGATTPSGSSTVSVGLTNDVGLLSEEYDVARRADGRATSRRRSATSRWCRRRSDLKGARPAPASVIVSAFVAALRR